MKYITVKPHETYYGVGHQFCNWLVPYILAKKYNIQFVHQNFSKGCFGNHLVDMPMDNWNSFLNFGENELSIDKLPHCIDETIDLPYIEQEEAVWNHKIYQTILSDQKFNKNILYKVSEQQNGQFLCIDWDFYKNNDLKKKYNNSNQIKNFKCYFDEDDMNIAIAIRRGDVTKDQQFRRWIDLDYYLHIIDVLSDIRELKHITFHIYALDMPEEEKNILLLHSLFGKREIKLHIDEDVFSTFYHFTKADIFVSGQGTFSLMANYLTDGIKLTTPFYMHWRNFPKDIKDIIEVNPDSYFDKNKLMEAMV